MDAFQNTAEALFQFQDEYNIKKEQYFSLKYSSKQQSYIGPRVSKTRIFPTCIRKRQYGGNICL
jgi:hypothetical protein